MQFPILKSIKVVSCDGRPSLELARILKGTYAIPANMLENGDMADDEDEIGVGPLTTMLSAASGMQNKLDSLSARNVHWAFFAPAPKGMSFYLPAFTHLRNLHLTLEADYADMDDEDLVRGHHREFGTALRGAANLESLALDFVAVGMAHLNLPGIRPLQVPVLWDKLAKATTWTNLRTLELGSVHVSEVFALDFFMRHADTLIILAMDNMTLTNSKSGWTKVFVLMQRVLILESVKFSGVWMAENATGKRAFYQMDKVGTKITKKILKVGAEEKPLRRGRSMTANQKRLSQTGFEVLDRESLEFFEIEN